MKLLGSRWRSWMRANAMERMDALDRSGVFDPVRQGLHEARYRFAAALAQDSIVADVACGTGYGSRILKQAGAEEVIGVDIDARTVRYAQRRYGGPGVRFHAAAATETPIPDRGVGLIVTLETMEHLPETEELLREFGRILAPGGRIVLSAPNDTGLTRHHVHTWTPFEFCAVVAPHFEIEAVREVHLGRGPTGVAAARIVEPGRLPEPEAESILLVARAPRGGPG